VRRVRKQPKKRSAPKRAIAARRRPAKPIAARELARLRPVWIPIVGPIGLRKGPKIIAVPSARVEQTKPAPAVPAVNTGGPTARIKAAEAKALAVKSTEATNSGDTAPARPAVRLGRLPPREQQVSGTPRPSRAAGYEAIPVTATLPRRPVAPGRWRDIEGRGARLGVTLDTEQRAVARAAAEQTSVLSTVPRGRMAEHAALAGALELPQCVLVVGPEAMVLSDLRERLERASVRALLLNDAKGGSPNPALLEGIGSGTIKVVLSTPRWLARDAVLRAVGKAGVAVVLVLEAQAISPCCPGFSPAYARLALHLDRLGRPPVFAFAPGATAEVRHDVIEAVLPAAPLVLTAQAPRVSLSALRCRAEVHRRALPELVARLPRPTLVLCSSPREVDAAHETLRSLGLGVNRYHEEMRTGVRAGEQLEFSTAGDQAILVATSAFAPARSCLDEDPDGVPARYGRRTAKTEIRGLVRLGAPASLEQLADELSLVGRSGKGGEAVVVHDPGDRPLVEAQTDGARPTGEQILLLARAFEALPAGGGAITTEALALSARSSRRAVEALADLLDGMGLVSHRDGWLTRLYPEPVVLKELRGLAERFATVRALDVRRLDQVFDLLMRPGCRTAALARALGDGAAEPCGACSSCRGEPETAGAVQHARQAPVRRFTVQTADASEQAAATTFHADGRVRDHSRLTAKLADFR
jgi:hypothetical protein